MRSTISVLTTLYNHEDFIIETLTSAVNQSYSPNQIVVLDDSSSDDSVSFAKQISNPIIEIHSEKYNLGGPNTVKGLSLCKADYIAILNSDDVWEKNKLKLQVEYLDTHPSCGAVFTKVKIIDENNYPWIDGSNKIMTLFDIPNRSRNEWLNYFFYKGNAFCASSAMVRRSIFDQFGLFDGRYIQLQDFEMWLRIALNGYDLWIINEPLTKYRIMRTGTNMSASNIKGKSLFEFEFSKILRNYWKIESLEELKSIFPEIKISNKADNSLVLFYLAQHANKIQTLHHRMFALETMSQWGGDPYRMSLAFECHNFSHKSYIKFLSEGPIKDFILKKWKTRLELILNIIFPYSMVQKIKEKLEKISKIKYFFN